MRFSRAFIPTRKEDPADAETPSHRLLIRAGFIEQVTAGIYNLLPLGWRATQKIARIVREEMDRAGALEMLMPMVQPAELWQRTGRWTKYGPALLTFEDRKGQAYCLGPTHEEVVTDLISRHVRSYRDMPLNLYQIQAKFRDEARPRAGLMRGREFIMKDAYSFDADLASAQESYAKMRAAYERVFTRCGLAFRAVEADTGNIGGSQSHEFQVLATTGEDRIVSCASCGYTANEEKAEVPASLAAQGAPDAPGEAPAREQVATPGKRTIAEVAAFLGVGAERLIKTLVYLADGAPVVVLVRGDHEVNEVKLRVLLGADDVVLAGERAVAEVTGAPVGFAGPVGLTTRVVADHAVAHVRDAVVGANAADAHLIHVDPARDLDVERYADLRIAGAGDPCPRCGADLEAFRGIEVGHIFVLGTRYSEPLGATYLDADGEERPVVMGCYGIGVTRILAAAVDQNHDDDGIIWPAAIAPYEVVVLPLQPQRDDVREAGEAIYNALREAGVDAALDDRDLRAGAKFKDADLIGVPYRVVIGGRSLGEGVVELKHRASPDAERVPVAQVAARVRAAIDAERARVAS